MVSKQHFFAMSRLQEMYQAANMEPKETRQALFARLQDGKIFSCLAKLFASATLGPAALQTNKKAPYPQQVCPAQLNYVKHSAAA